MSEITQTELIPRQIIVAHQDGIITDKDLVPNIAASLVSGNAAERAQMSTLEIIDRWQEAVVLARLCADEYLQIGLITE